MKPVVRRRIQYTLAAILGAGAVTAVAFVDWRLALGLGLLVAADVLYTEVPFP